MFRRSKSSSPEASAEVALAPSGPTSGKGRPTPTRKEAEAAARARARVPRTRKEQAARQRQVKTESSAQVRAAMKSGDERYLLGRDKGPVRRFCRDFVDSRFTVLELAIPLFTVSVVLGYTGLRDYSSALMLATILVLIGEAVLLRLRMRKEVSRRFDDVSPRGLTYYTLSRAMQPRFMRMPKARLKRGDVPPETYR